MLGGRWDLDDKAMKPYRTFMIVEARKLERCIVDLEKTLNA